MGNEGDGKNEGEGGDKKDNGKDYNKPAYKKEGGNGNDNNKPAYKKEGGYGKKGRKLAGHGDHDHKEQGKDGDKKPEKDGDKKPVNKGEEKAPSAELKAAMEACKKNTLCRELMECKMKHKESGGKGHDDKEVCVKEMKACEADKTCQGLHMKVQMLMKKEGGHGKGDDKKGDYGKDDKKGDYGKG